MNLPHIPAKYKGPEKVIVYLRPKAKCRGCHGTGSVTDWVPYGMGNTALVTDCDCVLEMLDEQLTDLDERDLLNIVVLEQEWTQ